MLTMCVFFKLFTIKDTVAHFVSKYRLTLHVYFTTMPAFSLLHQPPQPLAHLFQVATEFPGVFRLCCVPMLEFDSDSCSVP